LSKILPDWNQKINSVSQGSGWDMRKNLIDLALIEHIYQQYVMFHTVTLTTLLEVLKEGEMDGLERKSSYLPGGLSDARSYNPGPPIYSLLCP
jgi:hypothetical protein